VTPNAIRTSRLVIEAECTTCGRVGDDATDGISLVCLALAHSAATEHVVVLNGTTDIPEEPSSDREPNCLEPASSAQ
jgi:hypothetical protein